MGILLTTHPRYRMHGVADIVKTKQKPTIHLIKKKLISVVGKFHSYVEEMGNYLSATV